MNKNLNNDVETEYKKLGIKNRSVLVQLTKEAFLDLLKNKSRTFDLYMDLLCMEYIKYKKIEKKLDLFKFFKTFMMNYKNSKDFESTDFFELMKSVFYIDAESGENYLSISLNQPEISFESQYDDLYKIMKLLGELLEKCAYKNLRVFYGLAYYSTNKISPNNIFTLDFGGLVDSLKAIIGNNILNDPIYSIPINQWRNICEHKSYKFINNKEVKVEYGRKKKNIKIVQYDDLLTIVQNFNLINTLLKLISDLIYLDIMPDIQDTLNNYSVRLEESFAPLFLNLRTVDFSIIEYHYKQENNEFELLFEDLDTIEPTQSRIIHISQIFSRVAKSIYDDKILNIKPDTIKICLFHKQKNIANTTIRYEVALDFALKKIKMEELINNINFQIISDIK